MSSASTFALRDFWEAAPRSTGRSLREVLARGERPDRATLIDWGTQLLEILAEAHAEGALYRYLTEDEVFLTPEGRLLLAGWGSPGPLPGEPYTVQNDLYAAGCLLRRLAFASLRGGRGPGARVAKFPGGSARHSSRPSTPESPPAGPDGALWHALVLLVISLLLMTFLLVTGAVIVHRDQDARSWRSGELGSSLPPVLATH